MTGLRQKRVKSTGWRRFALGLLMLSWVTASAQPCLMGLEVALAAPDVSEQSEHSMHGMHGGHASEADGHDCGHCPPGDDHSSTPCSSGLVADCGTLPDYSVDARADKFKLDKNAFLVPGVACIPAEPGPLIVSPPCMLSCTGMLGHPTAPSLSVRYCVYLK